MVEYTSCPMKGFEPGGQPTEKTSKNQEKPLDKMKKSYYIIRGWKDGAPTMRMIRKLGIKLPECAKEVYPYGKG